MTDVLMHDAEGMLHDATLQSDQHSPSRIAIACSNCAATKTKCDRQYPCGRCRMKRLSCVSRQRQHRRGKTRLQSPIANESLTSMSAAIELPTPVPLDVELHDVQDIFRTSNQRPALPQQEVTAPSLAALRNPSHAGLEAESIEAPANSGSNQSPSLFFNDWETGLFDGSWSPAQFTNIFASFPPTTPNGAEQTRVYANSTERNSVVPTSPDTSPSRTGTDNTGVDLLRDWEHWSVFRCTSPPQQKAKDRAKSAIVSLDENFKRPGPWSDIPADWRLKHFESGELFTNIALSNNSREWLLIIAQRLLRIAMDIHGLNPDSESPSSPDSDELTSLRGYMRLPPSAALHNYLEIVLQNFEPFYPLIPARMLEPNQLADPRRGRGSSLLLFLMFAFGSMVDPAKKAQQLSTALTEICRHSMHNVLEKDSGVPGNGLLFYSALMFTLKSAFSGDKAHMNIATAHRLFYITSMRSASLFKKQYGEHQRPPAGQDDLRRAWQSWVEGESASRLAYGWVMLENEISLFYDCQPILNTSELEAILPADESIWLASSAEDWQQALCNSTSTDGWRAALQQGTGNSLRSLFQLMIQDQLDQPDLRLRPLHMRLLLYPLHVLVFQLQQLLDCGLTQVHLWGSSNPIAQNSSIIQFKEIRSLFSTWYGSYENLRGQGARFSAMRSATLVLYHIISLNLYTSFNKIERLAREGCANDTKELYEDLIRSPEHAIIHCGQVFRLFSQTEDVSRPIWSSAAIYRATITLWALSISKSRTVHGETGMDPNSDSFDDLVIDELPFQDSKVLNYLRSGKAKLYLTSPSGKISVENPTAILSLGMETISHRCSTTSFSAGVKWKLEEMAKSWLEKLQVVTTELRP